MKTYRLATELYLEWFDDEALLLVAECDLLLTLNRAGGVLFEALSATFFGRFFTLQDGSDWLGENYELTAAACRKQARSLLAFALKYHLAEVARAGELMNESPHRD